MEEMENGKRYSAESKGIAGSCHHRGWHLCESQ